MKILQLFYRLSSVNVSSSKNNNKTCTSNRNNCYNNNYNKNSSSNKYAYLDKMLVFITILIVNACIAGTIPATPENITVTFLTPTTVRVSWQTMIDLNAHPVEKYIVTYKPTDDSYRVVQDVAGNSEAVILDRLSPSTQYSIAVTAIWLGKKYRSRQIIFRTLDVPKPSSQQDFPNGAGVLGANAAGVGRATNGSVFGDDVTSTATNTLPHGRHRELPTIRGVEIGIVLIVLMVWAGAIALFFNRWGKIRMLLPYQPDYKHEQLKVPGTGVCSGGVCNGQHSHQEEHSASISERCTRSRINSAIFVSSEGRGFDSIEFLRRHGSQSVLCRKARSAENITDNNRKKSFAEKRQWRGSTRNGGGGDGVDRTEEETEQDDGNSSDAIEMKECRPSGETRTLSVLKSNNDGTAVLTASNIVVGSISLEAPPAYMKDDINAAPQTPRAMMTSPTYASHSHDSTDTVEELILVPTETKSRVLVHQRSSTASSTNRSQSPALSTPHGSTKALNLKDVKPKISALPMVSISGPSPPEEKPPPTECL